MSWFTGVVWPVMTLYLRLWLPIVAEVTVPGWAFAGLVAPDTPFARLPRALFNVGRHGQQIAWCVSATVTLVLYGLWLFHNGRPPLRFLVTALAVVGRYMWWPVLQALYMAPPAFA